MGVCRTNALESLVIAGFVRGLSVRDVEATLADALGPESTLSKSTVSRVCEAIKDEFDTWKRRDLSDIALEYLFLDGSHFRYHDGARAEPVLAAWGMTSEGRPVLVGLEPGSSESTDAWAGFLNGMVARGLRPPLLVISDGAPGLIAAAELVFPHSLRQRCLIHRARNILSKVPVEHQGEVKAEFWKIFDGIEEPPGDSAVALARNRAVAFERRYGRLFPAAVECLMADFANLTTYLRFPTAHHARIRHSNFIERTFGETRRRVKVIGRLPGERTCLGLVWAVLDRASRGWRGVVMTPMAVRQLSVPLCIGSSSSTTAHARITMAPMKPPQAGKWPHPRSRAAATMPPSKPRTPPVHLGQCDATVRAPSIMRAPIPESTARPPCGPR